MGISLSQVIELAMGYGLRNEGMWDVGLEMVMLSGLKEKLLHPLICHICLESKFLGGFKHLKPRKKHLKHLKILEMVMYIHAFFKRRISPFWHRIRHESTHQDDPEIPARAFSKSHGFFDTGGLSAIMAIMAIMAIIFMDIVLSQYIKNVL